MKNMKISMKLIVSFIIVIVMAVAVGVTGIIGMLRIDTADKAMYNDNYLPSVKAGDISQKIVEQRVLIRNFVIYNSIVDAEIFKKAQDSLTASRAVMDKLLVEYAASITTAEDQAAYDVFEKAYRDEWVPMVDSVYALGKASQTEQAKVMLTKASELAAKLDGLSTDLQQINMTQGQAAVDGNMALFKAMTILEVIILVLAIAVSVFLAVYISGLISKPMVFMKDVLAGFGTQGNLTLTDAEYDHAKKIASGKDEVSQSMEMLLATFMRLRKVGKALETVADGDLTTEIAMLSDRDTIGRSLMKMLDNLNNMFGEINSATAQVSIGSKQIADGAQSLAQGSTEQASAVQQLSASISEIAEKTKENAQMALSAANLAGDIKHNAEKGNMQMDQMMTAVREINEASQSISKVIGVIDNIAFQTNILALNAAVEAARAGQHGKGFAVVAEEVRSLASKSAEAAKETGALIANSMDKAELGARIAGETAASLVEIVSGINESTQIVGDIATSSNAQASAITEINTGIDQVAQVVQQNSATAEQSAAASQQMSGQADSLEQLIAQFKLKDSQQRSLGSGSRRPRRGIPESTSYSGGSDSGMGKY